MIKDHQSVVEDQLRETSKVLSYEEVTLLPSFAGPVKLYETWKALPGDVPHYSHIKPGLFEPAELPLMYILDVIEETAEDNDTGDVDFQFRLFGTANRDHYGKEGTRKRLSQMSHAGAGSGFDITKLAWSTRKAHFLYCEYLKNDVCVKNGSFVVMPLADDNGKVARMFGLSVWGNSV